MPPLLDLFDEEIANIDRMITDWISAGHLDDATKPIRRAQSAVAIRLAGAIRTWLTSGRPGTTTTAVAMLDPLRPDVGVEERQARVVALVQHLRGLVHPSAPARGLEAPDR